MRKVFLLVPIFAALISFSCEDEFNPKAEFKQKYVLWSIINANQNYTNVTVDAVLAKLYDVEGYNPYSNTVDPVLLGADVKLYADNIEYQFVQDTLKRRNPKRYDSLFVYYSTTQSVRMKYDSKFRIIAKLPGGEVLSAETSLPQNQGLEFSDIFVNGISTIRRDRTSSWDVWWETDGKHLFFPKLTITYQKTEGESTIVKSIPVPLRYEGKEAFYPEYSTEQSVSYSFDAIDSAMAKISEGDPVKSKYKILNMTFQLIEYDTPLSYYYSAINGYLDNYSIRLDETVYTNINGGLGVFGSLLSRNQSFYVSETYAKMFGYN